MWRRPAGARRAAGQAMWLGWGRWHLPGTAPGPRRLHRRRRRGSAPRRRSELGSGRDRRPLPLPLRPRPDTSAQRIGAGLPKSSRRWFFGLCFWSKAACRTPGRPLDEASGRSESVRSLIGPVTHHRPDVPFWRTRRCARFCSVFAVRRGSIGRGGLFTLDVQHLVGLGERDLDRFAVGYLPDGTVMVDVRDLRSIGAAEASGARILRTVHATGACRAEDGPLRRRIHKRKRCPCRWISSAAVWSWVRPS